MHRCGPEQDTGSSHITAPTLVVTGEYDLSAMTPMCHQLTDAIPHSRLTTIRQSAHCPSLDQPDELNRVVLEFLGSIR